MKRQNWLIVWVLSLALVVTACTSGNSGSDAGSSNNAGGKQANAGNNVAQGGSESKPPVQELEPYELVVEFPLYTEQKDMQMVENALNEITKKKINATVKLRSDNLGAYKQKMPLLLSGGDKVDLLFTGLGLYNAQVAKGQLYPMNELLEKHGQGIVEVLNDQSPEYLEATKSAGEIYGVPSIRDLASDYGFIMRKDLADKHGIDVSKIKTFDDLENVLQILKEKEPEMTLARTVGTTIGLYFEMVWDTIGDNLGVVMLNDDNLKVVNGFETQEYKDMVTRLHRWYQAGYIAKDAATTSQASSFNEVKAGTAYGYLAHMKPGFEVQDSRSAGYEMVATRLAPAVATTGYVTNIMWAIAHQSENPERAMMFLDMMFTDPEVVNLLDWGIEGTHYAKVEGTDNIIDFAPGVDATSIGYSPGMGWMFGNQLLSYIWQGDDPELWSKLSEFNRTAFKSPLMGFNYIADGVKTEIAAVTNVLDQYRVAFETGTIGPDKLPEFNAKLKDAGLDVIIAEKQKQIDEWKSKH
ncbi:ABC transporter substrate-binding protein [Paenibacillus sp. GCM10027626]|uniref:ABC transporter substrate-binding protein n=1 Tax=Paenibacillus sp. GCM10027626 TaxID=3273411 RepID=UPI003635904C